MSLSREISIWEFVLACGNELEAEFQLCYTLQNETSVQKTAMQFSTEQTS